jgi:hypothetical protein
MKGKAKTLKGASVRKTKSESQYSKGIVCTNIKFVFFHILCLKKDTGDLLAV